MRIRLLGPLLLLLLGAAVGWGLVSELSTRRQIEVLVDQQGTAILQGIDVRLHELRQAKELNARLLVDEPGLVAEVLKQDLVEVSQILAPAQAKLGVERVTVYTADAHELLNMGPRQVGVAVAPLIATALAGHTESAAAVTGEGLAVLAAAPILDYGRIVGALLVGTTLDGDALQEIGDRQGAELAVLRDGRLIDATTSDPDLARALRTFATATANRDDLQQALSQLHYRPTFLPLGDDGLVVALVSTRPLAEASDQRNLILVVGTIGLLVALLAIGLVLARDIARPLENLVTVTRDLVGGNYERRVLPSSIRELNELGDAVNHLAGELQRRIGELTHQAMHDSLTGLPNRTLLGDRLQRALARADRQTSRVALLFVDLDNFKLINDSLGHERGDQLLTWVAERLRSCLRAGDTAARLGGDEFVVLLEDLSDVNAASEIAERLAVALQAPVILGERAVVVTASVGVAVSSVLQIAPDELMRRADLALYRAKANGKGRHVLFEQSMEQPSLERLELETDLRQAIERDELRLVYQPIVTLDDSRLVGVEALVRWEHPIRGTLSPAQFILIAEETGLIVPLGRWVLEQACRQVRAWQSHLDAELMLNVNLSARQFEQPALAAEILSTLEKTGFPPRLLTLELTESALMRDAAAAIGTLQ
ncbi:MAG: diguanylate cyclase, partial [Chloroflexi bacterium]|nr:diguanylate cyclase [Chloroflexota bacterium]